MADLVYLAKKVFEDGVTVNNTSTGGGSSLSISRVTATSDRDANGCCTCELGGATISVPVTANVSNGDQLTLFVQGGRVIVAIASGTTTVKSETKIIQQIVDTGPIEKALAKKADIESPTLTGTPCAPTAAAGTNTTQIATCAFVQEALSGIAGGAMTFKGMVGNNNYAEFNEFTEIKAGWLWMFSDAFSDWLQSENCEAGDVLVCNTDYTASGASVGADMRSGTLAASNFTIIQRNLDYIDNDTIDGWFS
jgi:hypothetical protein